VAQTATSEVSSADLSSSVHLLVNNAKRLRTCPDAAQLRNALLAQGAKVPAARLQVTVTFDQIADSYLATTTLAGARVGVRELRLQTNDCRALVAPLVVSLSLLLEPDAAPNADGNVVAPKSSADSAVEQPTAARREDPPTAPANVTGMAPLSRDPDQTNPLVLGRSSAPRVTLDVGPQFILGLVPQTTYGLELQASAYYRTVSLRLAGMMGAGDERQQLSGRVRAQSQFLRMGLCTQRNWSSALSVGLCQGTWLGRLSVEGLDFATDRASQPWFLALGVVADVQWAFHQLLGLYLRGSSFVPLARHEFRVDGATEAAYRTAAIGASIGAGVLLKID
jgi:hypothetical protein